MLVEWLTEWPAPGPGEEEEWGATRACRTERVPPTPTEMPVACAWHGQASQAPTCPNEKSPSYLGGRAGIVTPMWKMRLEGS